MSALTMAADITFTESRGRVGFGFKRVSEIRVEKGWKDFTGIAEIVLPRNVRDFNRIEADRLFELGDPIQIKFGYDAGEIPIEFEGYISDVADGVPYRLKCEDEMFKLKRGSVTVSRKGTTLKQLLEIIAPGYKIECPDVPLGTVKYTNVAPIEILENLKKELGIYTYFIGKVLHSVDGNSQGGDTVNILLERNAVSENLNRKAKADEKILVRFRSLQRDGKYITFEQGDKFGTVQIRNWPYLTRAEIEIRARRIIEQQKAKGFDGTITLFGIPRIEHGMRVNLKSLFYKNIEGTYYIDKVVKTFSPGGIRQEITLGNKSI
ncbi:hypothetical protein [Dysgonomonas sp. ZJ279]|uniref:hypothetical protein n=1 Tax=Dysgonomonas sp. ZJ279 TaxID=2709796 RepID=UPI0013EE39E0|nr:hypothetical protein [Dysgonomonas sp. ZJ279]